MSYRIVVTRIETCTKKKGRVWERVGQEPAYPASTEKAAVMKDVYGYTPEIEVEGVEETKVLEQTVQNLELSLVIKAINRL